MKVQSLGLFSLAIGGSGFNLSVYCTAAIVIGKCCIFVLIAENISLVRFFLTISCFVMTFICFMPVEKCLTLPNLC